MAAFSAVVFNSLWYLSMAVWFSHHALKLQPKWWNHGRYMTMYTASGISTNAITRPKLSCVTVRTNARLRETCPR